MADLLLRTASLAEVAPEIAEAELPPVLTAERDLRLSEAQVRLRSSEQDDPLLRRLGLQ